MTAGLVFDTSVYISILRDAGFASALRERYRREVPRIHFSSVVIEELLAGARTLGHRRQAVDVYEPFEKVGRVVTPSHEIWKETGRILARLAARASSYRDRLSRGFANDVLIALSARSIGATVVTRNKRDFELIREVRSFALEIA